MDERTSDDEHSVRAQRLRCGWMALEEVDYAVEAAADERRESIAISGVSSGSAEIPRCATSMAVRARSIMRDVVVTQVLHTFAKSVGRTLGVSSFIRR